VEKGLPNTKYQNLSPEFISDFLFYFRRTNKNGNSKPGEKISLAIAFANLYLADPADVTDHHKKMLKKEFSAEEINELTHLINNELNS
jgi:alkylhydroperoxidase family enzyme